MQQNQPCNRRLLTSGPCESCQICTTVESPPLEWKDVSADVISMIPLNARYLDQQKLNKYYLPYIKQLEASKPRTYLFNHTNDRNILKWIQEALPSVKDHQIHFWDCEDPQCVFRRTLPSEHVPYRGWNAFNHLQGHCENPDITYGYYDKLWSLAIKIGAEHPEREGDDNIRWHNIHKDITIVE